MYCYICERKIYSGLAPQCCDEVECICVECHETMMSNRMSSELSNYIQENIKIKGKKAEIPVTKELSEWLDAEAKCPACGADWTDTEFEDC